MASRLLRPRPGRGPGDPAAAPAQRRPRAWAAMATGRRPRHCQADSQPDRGGGGTSTGVRRCREGGLLRDSADAPAAHRAAGRAGWRAAAALRALAPSPGCAHSEAAVRTSKAAKHIPPTSIIKLTIAISSGFKKPEKETAFFLSIGHGVCVLHLLKTHLVVGEHMLQLVRPAKERP